MTAPARVAGIDHVLVSMPRGGEDAARAFYGGVLGLREVPKPPPLDTHGGCWFVSDANPALSYTYYTVDFTSSRIDTSSAGTITVKPGSEHARPMSSMPICDGPSSPIEMPACVPTARKLFTGG